MPEETTPTTHNVEVRAPSVVELEEVVKQSRIAQAAAIRKQLDRSFEYHAPKEGQPALYRLIRAKAKDLALLFLQYVPPCKEQQISITKIEEAVMFANKGIAMYGEAITTP